jgi:hypothetical protein
MKQAASQHKPSYKQAIRPSPSSISIALVPSHHQHQATASQPSKHLVSKLSQSNHKNQSINMKQSLKLSCKQVIAASNH